LIKEEDYQLLYRLSIEHPEEFWDQQARHFLEWFRPWDRVFSGALGDGDVRWFDGGQLNVAHNCIDRHLAERGEQPAIIWEGDDPSQSRTITYHELHQRVCRLANLLRQRGVGKGDRVCIYLPMIPEAAYAMLACARIGAIHSVVFAGFSPEALRDRILDADCRTVITADEGLRGGKTVPLKANVDKALASCPAVSSVIVVRRTNAEVTWVEGRDLDYELEQAKQSEDCPA